MAQPTVILIHGTWHGAWCWAAVRERLDQRGIASLAPSLKGVGERFDEADESVGVDDHIADVVAAIRTADAPCVVVGHSYGSIPMWGAASVVLTASPTPSLASSTSTRSRSSTPQG